MRLESFSTYDDREEKAADQEFTRIYNDYEVLVGAKKLVQEKNDPDLTEFFNEMVRLGFKYLDAVDRHQSIIRMVGGNFERRGEIENADEARRYTHNAFIDGINIFLRLANREGP